MAQCIVIGPVCDGWVCLCGLVCYHDNSKLRASILTKNSLKLGQQVKFWPSRAPGKGSAPPYYSQRAVFASLWALFHCLCHIVYLSIVSGAWAVLAAGWYNYYLCLQTVFCLCILMFFSRFTTKKTVHFPRWKTKALCVVVKFVGQTAWVRC